MKSLNTSGTRSALPLLTTALSVAILLASLGTSIVNIALPLLGAAFSAPFSAVQMVVVAYLTGLTVAALAAGQLGDRFGLRPVLAVGLMLFGASSLLCGLAGQLPVLIAARLLQGTGAAFMMTLSMALMRQNCSSERLGRSLGLLGSLSALGTALGPALGGLLLPLTGWQGLFLILLPLTSAALILLLAASPGQTPVKRSAPPGLRQVVSRPMLLHLAINLLVAAVMMTTLVVGPFYLTQGLQLTAGMTGVVMACGPLTAMCCGVPAGRLVDRFGYRRVQPLGLAMIACGTLLLAVTGLSAGLTGYLLTVTIVTPGYQLCQVASNSAVLAKAAENQRGTVSGLLNLSRNLGLIAGASLMGALFAWGVGTPALASAGPEPIAAGMQLTFMLAGVTTGVAVLITLWTAGAE